MRRWGWCRPCHLRQGVYTRQGGAIAAGKGIFPAALAQRDGNGVAALRYPAVAYSPAQRAAEATRGEGLPAQRAAYRILARGSVWAKKKSGGVPRSSKSMIIIF